MTAASGAKLDAALTDLGWLDMLDEIPDVAVPLVFRLLGETGAHAPVLNDVVLRAAGAAPGGTLPLPFAGGSWVVWERGEGIRFGDRRVSCRYTASPQGDSLPPAALPRGGGRWAGGWSAPAGRCWRWRASMPWTASSSAGTSARSRRSGTGWPRRSSRSRAPRRRCTSPPQSDDHDGLASLLAKAAAGQAALTAARHCQQVLGGIGFTAEHPLHHHVKRSLILDGLLGSARELTREAGKTLRIKGFAPRLAQLSQLAPASHRALRPDRSVTDGSKPARRFVWPPREWDAMSQPDAPRNEIGVASLILGLVALLTCWLLIGVPFGIAAVMTGDVARRRVQRGEADNPRIAMAGMVLGAVAIAAGLVAIG